MDGRSDLRTRGSKPWHASGFRFALPVSEYLSVVQCAAELCQLQPDIQQTPLPPRWQDFLIHDWWVSARLPVAITMRHSERAYLCFGGWVEGCSAQLRFPIQVSSVL